MTIYFAECQFQWQNPAVLLRAQILRSNVGATHNVYSIRRAMESGHLLYSVFTCPPGGNARHLSSRHPVVPAAQQLITWADDNNRSVTLWADQRWNAEWLENTTRLHTFIHDIGTPLPGMAPPRAAWVRPSPHRCRTFTFLFAQMRYCPFCCLWVWRSGTDGWPCCPSLSNPLISLWSAWPDVSGWRDNRMAA